MPTRVHRLIASSAVLIDSLIGLREPINELTSQDIKFRDSIEDDLVELGNDWHHLLGPELLNKLARADARIREMFDRDIAEYGEAEVRLHWDTPAEAKGIPRSRWWWYPVSSKAWANAVQLVSIETHMDPGSFGLVLADDTLSVPWPLHVVLIANNVTKAKDVFAFIRRGKMSILRLFGWEESHYVAALFEAEAILPPHLKLTPLYIVRTGALLPSNQD